jgi:hypothetical protein
VLQAQKGCSSCDDDSGWVEVNEVVPIVCCAIRGMDVGGVG